MTAIKPLHRGFIAFAALCGVLAFGFVSVTIWIELPGDDPRAINQARTAAEEFVQLAKAKTLWAANLPNAETAANSGSVLDFRPELGSAQIADESQRRLTELGRAWDKAGQASSRLRYPNRGTVLAKAIAKLPSSPFRISRAEFMALLESTNRHAQRTEYEASSFRFEWDRRLERAADSLIELSNVRRSFKAASAGLIALVSGFVAGWLGLLLATWLWYFSLDRLRELGEALRGYRH